MHERSLHLLCGRLLVLAARCEWPPLRHQVLVLDVQSVANTGQSGEAPQACFGMPGYAR
ncbi:MAG TPA: hypothetical protein VKU02_23860 [Gemmataceae bacterium]|nr:hypothetical protein [Gemmataceae bacterium]